MDWQKTAQTIKQFAFPRKAALERELSAARDESRLLTAELESTRGELQDTLSKDARQIDALRQQLTTLESEHSTARHQVQLLGTSLEQAAQRQAGTEQQLRSLESSLEQERGQARHLEELLQQAAQRQAGTEQQLATLEARLEQERRQHEASLDSAQETLTLLQGEQHRLQSLQSEQAVAFSETGRQLLESLQVATARPPLPVFQVMAVAGLLFLCGSLVGVLAVRDFQQGEGDLAQLGLGIRDMRAAMQQSFDSQNEIMSRLTEALDRISAQDDAPDVGTVTQPADKPAVVATAPTDTLVRRTVRRTARGEWGPLLVMEGEPGKDEPKLVFDPQVKEQQNHLMALGFNLGQRQADGLKGDQTERALEEFKLLYLPVAGIEGVADDDRLTAVIKKFADKAREDERTYMVDSGVLAAIRLGSLHTEVDFSFLMELAAVESSFDPASRARTSTAAGLYQFKEDTWLEAVRNYGDKYGMASYAAQVEEVVDSKGRAQPVIRDPAVSRHVLDLRHNPRVAALLAAEYVSKNMQRLLYSLDREPGRTELYLTHFLGASGAISFLKALHEDPDRIARDIFPGPASRNRNIFRGRDSTPRTLAEIYEIFSRKFNTARYEES